VQSLCEVARDALFGNVPFGRVVEDVARDTLDRASEHLSAAGVRAELQNLASADAAVYTELVRQALVPLTGLESLLSAPLRNYLTYWPSAIRQGLRRPSDPTGRTVPAGLTFDAPAELIRFLPPRIPRLRPGPVRETPEWELTRYCGVGEVSEVWAGRVTHGGETVALKFVTDPAANQAALDNERLLTRALELGGLSGIVPLRIVYLDPKRVCLESGYAPGYDLAGVMFDWKWRWGRPVPEPTIGLIRRLSEVVAKAHARQFVHRSLKPSNVTLMPTEGGRFALWVTDFGWGPIAAARAARAPIAPEGVSAIRGTHTALYLAPQVSRNEPIDPRDDVYSIGRMWYQLLRQEPTALPDAEGAWAEELAEEGVPEAHLELLAGCLAREAKDRPADASVLAQRLRELTAPTQSTQSSTSTARAANIGPISGSFAIDPKSMAGIASAPGKPDPNSGRYTGTPGPVTSSLSANVALGRARRTNIVINSIGMTFALIPAGRFIMGSESDADHTFVGDELPQHPVRITRPFFLGVFPVTQGEFASVMGRNPSYFNESRKGGPSHPVEAVTWYEAETFCAKLGQLPAEVAAKRRYVLPTEAEWEYACRAGTKTPYWPGDKLTSQLANFTTGSERDRKTTTGDSTLPVGQYRPNLWGLYDMHGNVAEWTHDWYFDQYYSSSPIDDPQGPPAGSAKVTRGGCWQSFATECRSAARAAYPPDRPSNRIGFRVIMLEGEG
jgi:formylglycine-generating enzyme required for sulfatase activity